MKKSLVLSAVVLGLALCAIGDARDAAVVKSYILRQVGTKTIDEIRKKEGGEKFLKSFFTNRAWMEAFAGSGRPGGTASKFFSYADALKALDLLVWNDRGDFISTPLGRKIATALALDHGGDWSAEKLVQHLDCYREWDKDGTLHDSAYELDTWGWREVLTMGQNSQLPVENLRWIHDYATCPAPRYAGVCWTCSYRLNNCFGATVHGPQYYQPWEHCWNTQELRYRVGGVCGALSKFGSHCAASHGVRSFTAGQPGHCAFMLWDFKNDRWGQAYSVTSHTGAHFTLGGDGWPALEEQNRYYSNPKRMDAEFLRWKGNYAEAMALVPGNWNAAEDWLDELEAHPSAEGWAKLAEALRTTFRTEPCQGWQLYRRYLKLFSSNQSARMAEARKGLLAFVENKAKTCEPMYYDERVLTPLFDLLGGGDSAVWDLFQPMLDGQAASDNYYPSTINWAAGRLMKNPEDSKRFLKIVGANALKTKRELDFSGMIRTASDSEDVQMFRQVYTLLDKLAPKLAPKIDGRAYPENDYGFPLLSKDGVLKISNTSEWDTPISYRNVIDAPQFVGGNGFHTGKDEAPWAEVILPGDCEIAGVTIVNSGGGQNGGRQVPLEVSVSPDGLGFVKVWSTSEVQNEWRVKLPSPVVAKYIRVGRTKNPDRKEVFHLHKILVYGKKLY